jgi:hypothetical protein
MAVPFVVNEVVVSPGPRHDEAVALLRAMANLAGLVIDETSHSKDLSRVLNDPDYQRTPRSFVLKDKPGDFRIGNPNDAPALVENATRLAPDPELGLMLGVNRVLTAHAMRANAPYTSGHTTGGLAPYTSGHTTGGLAPYTSGHETGGYAPYTSGHESGGLAPYTSGHGTGQYALIGSGARQPVEWVGAAPARRRDNELADTDRRPVVVTLDTGIGRHDWFTEGVERGLSIDGVDLGYHGDATDPERKGLVFGELTGALDSHSGHGTFIAGLIRQTCPDADIRAVRVMNSNGVADEYELLRCLLVLAELARRRRQGRADGAHVDVIVLSLGYRHETAQDERYDNFLLPVLRELGALGVAVVAAAGNGASTEPVYPAAFSPHKGGPVRKREPGVVPVTSGGSCNPNGTVALFSDAGPWVSCWVSGAALVSTMPTTLSGGAMPVVSFLADDGSLRSTIDLDDFTGGFGVWSGTSFAAPVFAGKVAAALLASGRLGTGLSPDEVSDIVTALVREHPLPKVRRR